MLPWELLATAPVPSLGKEPPEELRLYRHGDEFSIRVGRIELMNSRFHASEERLATEVADRLAPGAKQRMLVGGLGMGFTLAALLARAPKDAEVAVAELVPEVVEWNRGPLAQLAGNPLRDRRVVVIEQDVAAVIRRNPGKYDVILLDIDNGPAGLTSATNSRLYGPRGLRAIFDALRPRGLLGVWSEAPDPRFTTRLRQCGFESEEIAVRGAGGGRGPRYHLWVARRS